MNDKRKEYLKKWREDNKEHIRHYKKEYAKTHDSSFKKLQNKYKQLQQENEILQEELEEYKNPIKYFKYASKNVTDENKKLKDNWNKLKEFIKDKYVYYEKETLDFFYGYKVGILGIRDKMQEIEKGSDSNE